MKDRNSRIGSTFESLLREDGAYEDVENEAIASVLAYKRGSARAESDEPAKLGDSPPQLKSARRAPSVARAGSGNRRFRIGARRRCPRKTRTPADESPGARSRNGDGHGRRRRTAARLSSLRQPELVWIR